MKCLSCKEPAVINDPARCKDHFVEDFENKVKETIEKYELIKPNQKIAVAASGGKDSLTILTLLNRWYDDVTAIVVDEGIEGYREKTLTDLRKVCKEQKIQLLVKSYKELTGFTLDEILKKKNFHACIICGTFRRHLISIASKGFDVLATGHNADDEAQTVLMNILKGTTDVFPRNGPKTGIGAVEFTQRIKPLYFVAEKEVATYAFIKGFISEFIECPNASDGFRYMIREEINNYSKDHSDVKQRILEKFLEVRKSFPTRTSALPSCEKCGEPASNKICKTCEFLEEVKILP